MLVSWHFFFSSSILNNMCRKAAVMLELSRLWQEIETCIESLIEPKITAIYTPPPKKPSANMVAKVIAERGKNWCKISKEITYLCFWYQMNFYKSWYIYIYIYIYIISSFVFCDCYFHELLKNNHQTGGCLTIISNFIQYVFVTHE